MQQFHWKTYVKKETDVSAGIGIAQDMGMAKYLLPCHEQKQADIPGDRAL